MKKIAKRLWRNSLGYLKLNWSVVLVLVVVVGALALAVIERTSIEISFNTSLGSNQTINAHTTKLLQSLKKYERASGEAKIKALDELTSVALERKNALKAELKKNAGDVVLNSIPAAILAKIPAQALPFMEREVTVEGTVSVVYFDAENTSEVQYLVDDTKTGKKFRLNFDKQPKNIKTGDKVKAKGLAVEQEVALALENTGSGTTFSSTPVTQALVSGSQRTLIMMVNFSDDRSEPISLQDAANALFYNSDSANAYYQQVSFGNVGFSGDVVGYYQINATAAGCNIYDYSAKAVSAAQAAGANPGGYTRHVVVFPRNNYCLSGSSVWYGMGTMGGNPSTLWLNGSVYSGLIAHEIGHNLGMWHASAELCGSEVVGSSCTFQEYGDPYDVMGHANRFNHNNGPHKGQMGWISTQTVTTSGTYTVSPLEIQGSKVLRIPIGTTGEYYFISYRQPMDFDGNLPGELTNGVSVHKHNGSTQTRYLDVTPDNYIFDSALRDGMSFTDSRSNITVTQLSHDESSATVQISVSGAPVCTRSNPTFGISPVTYSGTAGQTLVYSLVLKNNDSSACTNTTFSLSNTLPSGFTATFGVNTLTLGPGATGNTQVRVNSPSSAADGSYTFTTRANSSQHQASVSAAYIVYSTSSGTPSANCTKAPSITDSTGGVWTIGPNRETLRNDVHMGGGLGTMYKYVNSVVYVLGEPASANTWWSWNNSSWSNVGAEPTCGTTPPPPAPTPVPPPPSPTPVPPPAPTPPPTSTAPTVTISSPTANSTITGRRVNINTSASSSSRISKIEIVVDGKLLKSCKVNSTFGSCSQNWDISKLSYGSHVITARAYDSSDATKIGTMSITVTK